ncbi:inositol oxygenase-like isoform X2 [Tubulanus polymorphus]
MHTYQSVDFVRRRLKYWGEFDHIGLTIMEALEALNALIDESDPDLDLPNSIHGFQTAERIRAAHPDKEWLQVTGLVHDLGKVMALFGEPQWAVVGDTFPVGCAPSDAIVFGRKSFQRNQDFDHHIYSTKLGMYKENCGLDNVMMSWGHDEYMYRVLANHKHCSLPKESLFIVRFHSFYPWHSGDAYDYLSTDHDRKMMEWVREFNKFDLYSKSTTIPDIDELRDYYEKLVDKFIPGKVRF